MTAATPRIVALEGAGSADIQTLFAAEIANWRASGLRVAGVVEEAHGLEDRACTGGILRDIASGTPFPIYLETVPENTSCHLDANGARAASAELLRQIATCDLVVLSKFGKLEAARDGLADVFTAAIASGKPVVTTVSEKHREAWRAFVPHAVFLPAERAALQAWAAAVTTLQG